MRRRLLAIVCGLVCAAMAAPALAQGDADDEVYSTRDQRYKHKEGEYGGVTPGVIYPYDDKDYKKRFKRPTNSGKRKRRVTWVGFQPRDGGASRLFLQLTSEVEYSQAVVGDTLKVWVHSGRLANSNARRRLDMRHFDSALLEARARRVSRRRAKGDRPGHPRGVELTVRFKNPADVREAQASLTKEQDNYYYLFLDFGPGTAAPDGGDTAGDEP
jgi:hypothetical protein